MLILHWIFQSLQRNPIHISSKWNQGYIFSILFCLFDPVFPLDQTDAIMLIQDLTVHSFFQRQIQALNISQHMIQSGSCSSKNRNMITSKGKCQLHGDLCVCGIFYRIVFPDLDLCILLIPCKNFRG